MTLVIGVEEERRTAVAVVLIANLDVVTGVVSADCHGTISFLRASVSIRIAPR